MKTKFPNFDFRHVFLDVEFDLELLIKNLNKISFEQCNQNILYSLKNCLRIVSFHNCFWNYKKY